MKYERITTVCHINNDGTKEYDIKENLTLTDVYNYIGCLEDKIEDGTLVELPKPYIEGASYDNGDTRYQVWHSRIETHCSYVEDTFTTKEAAEARLKELTEKE